MTPLRIYVDFVPPPAALELLWEGTAGHELVFASNPVTSVLAKAVKDPQVDTADVLFGQPDVEALLGAPKVRWAHVSSSGVTRYDTPEVRVRLRERGIRLTNSAAVYAEACALQAMSFILAEARSLPTSLASRAANGTSEWNALRDSCVSPSGQRILLVGHGAIATRLAAFLAPLGAEVFGYRRNPRGDEPVPMVPANRFEDWLGTMDQVVDILPESGDTRGFFDARRFAAMKPGAVFHNIGRGATVDQEALLDALRSGRLKSAWLDVTTPEPLPDDHPLRREPRCHITPHVAGGHRDETSTLVRHFNANLARFVAGQELVDRVV